jgi:hypothetical protein
MGYYYYYIHFLIKAPKIYLFAHDYIWHIIKEPRFKYCLNP